MTFGLPRADGGDLQLLDVGLGEDLAVDLHQHLLDHVGAQPDHREPNSNAQAAPRIRKFIRFIALSTCTGFAAGSDRARSAPPVT